MFVVALESEKCPNLMKDGSRQEKGSVNSPQAMEFLKNGEFDHDMDITDLLFGDGE